jgi:hypothetical protein
MDDNRIIDGYAVLHTIWIDGAEQIVAEKDHQYRLYRGERVSGLGIEEYTVVFEDRDYLKAMREFTRRINSALDGLDLSRVYRGSPLMDFRLNLEDCVSGGMANDLRGKVVAIKAEILSPEYRAGSYQLMLAEGGFGCSPNARGQSVFCKELYSGESARWGRTDILGVVDESLLPTWAKEKLSRLREPAPRESVVDKIRAAKPVREQEPQSPKHHKSEPER